MTKSWNWGSDITMLSWIQIPQNRILVCVVSEVLLVVLVCAVVNIKGCGMCLDMPVARLSGTQANEL